MSRNFKREAAKSLLIPLSMSAAFGASVASADENDLRLRLAAVKDQILVTGERVEYTSDHTASATKTDTALIDIPQSISLITRDLIDDQMMRSMADVVQYVPGVSMGQGEGHRDAPTLRGNSSTADFYVDGVRDDVQYYRDLYNANRIEILKGPNAMIFGRGGGGGVINRVTKTATFDPVHEVTLQAGSFGYGRGAADVGAVFSDKLAGRLNAFYENSDSYRDYVGIERFGVNPTAQLSPSDRTSLNITYEYLNDMRTVDRGVPSENGLPYSADVTAYFGNPNDSYSRVAVNAGDFSFTHALMDSLTIKNHLRLADYNKNYQNVHAGGAISATGQVPLQAYFSATQRRNFFNQTDLIWETHTGAIEHTILFGGEVGVQDTDNIRSENNNSAGFVTVDNPTSFAPGVFSNLLRNDNHVDLTTASVYFQDQLDVTKWLQLIAGVRFDHFDLGFADNLTSTTLSRTDNVWSPRGGVVVKPTPATSLYFSYSKSFLPQSGDQFSSLSASTAALEPESFENIEAGLKWELRTGLTLSAAVYQLDRKNTRAPGPTPGITVLTGSQRSKGLEVSLAGAVTERWEVLAGYTLQDAEITSTTSAAAARSQTPLVPKHALAIWNAYSISEFLRASVGVIHQTDQFASITNQVILPGFTKIDAAIYLTINEHLEAQLNVENLLDKEYFPTAHHDNNITPGSPRAFRVSVTGRL
ncbi:MAG: TonB-dependent siderophore receptor [Parvularculaceae bacterium]|nr:TonB-dependent siderophore receptor [Parvularculaceae bacterium]